MEQRCRVDESMYPHSYNPNLNLVSSALLASYSTHSPSRWGTRKVEHNAVPAAESPELSKVPSVKNSLC